jgi:hypothetical protein
VGNCNRRAEPTPKQTQAEAEPHSDWQATRLTSQSVTAGVSRSIPTVFRRRVGQTPPTVPLCARKAECD